MLRDLGLLAIVAGGLLLSPPAQAAAIGSRTAELGYLMVQGRQVLLLTASSGTELSTRAGEIKRRLEAAVSKDGTLQPVGDVKLTDVAGTPVISIGRVPVATVTPRDAARAGQPAWVLAHKWADALNASLGTLRIGNPVPDSLVKLKGAAGSEIALDQPASAQPVPATPLSIALQGGRITATIAARVVTLTGHAETLAEKIAVATRVAAVPGVVDVVNSVVVDRVNNSVVRATQAVSDAEVASSLGAVSP